MMRLLKAVQMCRRMGKRVTPWQVMFELSFIPTRKQVRRGSH